MDTFVRKLTTQAAWLRPVAAETPIMRIMGKVHRGTEEISTFGAFTRWQGQFAAQVVCNPGPLAAQAPQGVVREMASYEMILPNVAADWLASYMTRVDQGRGTDPTATATGVVFKPVGDLSDIQFVIDLSIRPPSSSKPSERGYEFAVAIAKADPRHNPMAGLLSELGQFSPFQPLQGRLADAAQSPAPAGEGTQAGSEAAQAAD
jgi:hypothetical protein